MVLTPSARSQRAPSDSGAEKIGPSTAVADQLTSGIGTLLEQFPRTRNREFSGAIRESFRPERGISGIVPRARSLLRARVPPAHGRPGHAKRNQRNTRHNAHHHHRSVWRLVGLAAAEGCLSVVEAECAPAPAPAPKTRPSRAIHLESDPPSYQPALGPLNHPRDREPAPPDPQPG
jgi:hypothetical protein